MVGIDLTTKCLATTFPSRPVALVWARSHRRPSGCESGSVRREKRSPKSKVLASSNIAASLTSRTEKAAHWEWPVDQIPANAAKSGGIAFYPPPRVVDYHPTRNWALSGRLFSQRQRLAPLAVEGLVSAPVERPNAKLWSRLAPSPPRLNTLAHKPLLAAVIAPADLDLGPVPSKSFPAVPRRRPHS
jgi:hypothetical protein